MSFPSFRVGLRLQGYPSQRVSDSRVRFPLTRYRPFVRTGGEKVEKVRLSVLLIFHFPRKFGGNDPNNFSGTPRQLFLVYHENRFGRQPPQSREKYSSSGRDWPEIGDFSAIETYRFPPPARTTGLSDDDAAGVPTVSSCNEVGAVPAARVSTWWPAWLYARFRTPSWQRPAGKMSAVQ